MRNREMSKSLFQKQGDQLLMNVNFSAKEEKKNNYREKKDKRKSFKNVLKKGEKNECRWKNKQWLMEIGPRVQTDSKGTESYMRQM